jgi:hypothetical protein
MKKLLVIIFLLIPPPILSQSPEIKHDQNITLLFSSNVWGEIDPCG